MELETKVIENEQRSKSNVHRLDRLEERVNEQDKLAKTTEIQAQLDDLDRLNNALSAMSSVSKAVQ